MAPAWLHFDGKTSRGRNSAFLIESSEKELSGLNPFDIDCGAGGGTQSVTLDSGSGLTLCEQTIWFTCYFMSSFGFDYSFLHFHPSGNLTDCQNANLTHINGKEAKLPFGPDGYTTSQITAMSSGRRLSERKNLFLDRSRHLSPLKVAHRHYSPAMREIDNCLLHWTATAVAYSDSTYNSESQNVALPNGMTANVPTPFGEIAGGHMSVYNLDCIAATEVDPNAATPYQPQGTAALKEAMKKLWDVLKAAPDHQGDGKGYSFSLYFGNGATIPENV